MLQGEMRARVSWIVVLAVYLAFPPFQRERAEEMGFGEILGMERMRADPALTQALRSRWDAEATAFKFPWGHMIPSLEDRLLELPEERRSSLVPRVPLQESLGLFDVAKVAGESDNEHLDRLTLVSRRELASEPGAQADLDLRRFLVLFLGRLLFTTRRDVVHCRFLPLLEDVGEVWTYLHLSALGTGVLALSGLVPIARRWDPIRDSRSLGDQLERLQEAIDSYPYLDVVWQPYLGEVDEGQPWLVQARPYFGSAVEFPVRDRFRTPGRSFRGLHDTTDWREWAKEQIDNWERRGKAVKSDATTDDAYLQAYALKYSGKVYKSARHQVDVSGEIASLRALLYSAVQDREAAQRQTAELWRELERVRSTGAGGASSSRGAGGSPSLLEAQLAGAETDLRLTTEHAMDLQGLRDQLQGQRDQLQGEI
ncbi:hypothetical protein Taro_000474 [Colocasia esculenta]|uniref:Uncharacterized protein n=1 Tax=Colocasia esculenta TaxID=4460 RepID=A0A843T822_COLES|nr:hypothetical protein [Colocasia esculenta]